MQMLLGAGLYGLNFVGHTFLFCWIMITQCHLLSLSKAVMAVTKADRQLIKGIKKGRGIPVLLDLTKL